ncbi:MAG: hypothetical protein A3E01_05885 [Gammaproteobacteria bacterium RIFCSPHIGHO2_12_FULL_63_22]|nr:MAG: hypothetical protein A3E01_05885 [Gammaproteobacteria bacterium RIFCSPHIGHO2_12_FULL_63_22]
MTTDLLAFRLINARISKLVVDERAGGVLVVGKELDVVISRSLPEVSVHPWGTRPVIELRVSASATLSGTGERTMLDKVFHVECTGAFVSAGGKSDGKLDAFQPMVEAFSRSLYWILRERLDSVFAVTALRSANLPWDLPEIGHRLADTGPQPPPAATKRAPVPRKKLPRKRSES